MSANQKRVWPELVGKDANSALKILKEESGQKTEIYLLKNDLFSFHSGIDDIQTVRDNSPVTLDFCPTRIRIFVDEKNIVTVDPRIG